MVPSAGETYGFLTHATLCIGCKQWNQLPADAPGDVLSLTGFTYDNTVDLGATTWRHVAFVERLTPSGVAWLMLSDVCRHCVHASCLDACPTGAIMRTEFGTVVIQDNICNGCGYCIPACPFGVPQLGHHDGGSHKCTLCYDRLCGGLAPACATSCPTDSFRFGLVDELRELGRERVATLQAGGLEEARLYSDDVLGGTGGIAGLNAMFVFNGPPEAFNLPAKPRLPRRNILPAAAATLATGSALAWQPSPLCALGHDLPVSSQASAGPHEIGYYGVPVIHASHWKWLIVVIAAIARLSGGAEAARLSRIATYVSFAALLPCPPLLILDLGRPLRFVNKLRAFRPSSPMSLGSWGLTAFGAVSTLAAATQLRADVACRRGESPSFVQERVALALAPLNAISGVFLAGYTGTLLAATGVPLWAKRPALLGPLFLASAMTSGTAAVAVVHAISPHDDATMTDRLHRLEAIATIAEGALLAAWLISLGPTRKPLTDGHIGAVVRHGVVGAGMTAPLALTAAAGRLPRSLRRLATLVAPALTLCGVFALRYAVVEGGRLSANDPQATFDLTG